MRFFYPGMLVSPIRVVQQQVVPGSLFDLLIYIDRGPFVVFPMEGKLSLARNVTAKETGDEESR